MTIKSAIFILFLPLLIVAQYDYFPLQIGNMWVYQYRPDAPLDTFRIIDTVVINKTRYFTFVNSTYLLPNDLLSDTAYIRKDVRGNLWRYFSASGQEYPWFEFDLTLDSSYIIPAPDSLNEYVKCTYLGVENMVAPIFGNTINSCQVIHFIGYDSAKYVAESANDYFFLDTFSAEINSPLSA